MMTSLEREKSSKSANKSNFGPNQQKIDKNKNLDESNDREVDVVHNNPENFSSVSTQAPTQDSEGMLRLNLSQIDRNVDKNANFNVTPGLGKLNRGNSMPIFQLNWPGYYNTLQMPQFDRNIITNSLNQLAETQRHTSEFLLEQLKILTGLLEEMNALEVKT